MQQKITNVFSNLLRQWTDDDEEERQALLQSQQEQAQLEDYIREQFKGLKWTRVVSI